MSLIKTIRWGSAALAVAFNIYAVITAMRESILQIPQPVQADPWFQLSIVDAYIGLLIFWVWVAYREKTTAARVFWFIALMLLGSGATTLYIWLAAKKLPDDAPLSALFLRPSPEVIPSHG